jgi:LEA14-like dessication related protein
MNNYPPARLSIVLLLIPLLVSCGLTRQTRMASNLANCDFRLNTITNISLSGVNLAGINSMSDLNFTDAARIMAGLAGTSLPLSMTVNLEGRNPNAKPAGVSGVEWILLIDDVHMTSGFLNEPFVIPAGGTTVIPVLVALDLKTVLSGKPAEALIKFSMNMAGMGTSPSRLKIKMKPTISVGGSHLKYPGYITITTSYGKSN